ncbi:hypothetical protein [Natrinema sp. 1APR25-10V2]|uniref:hypothetical protein n=1 Tax=Natrinema sp. 1APR25-10V2 TaxID=2951081 RepID=UPI0028747145|nr:hypothetical protein [Natrinema sp. 1APR25-10V2]MDS0476666.1 hypothetical protein [Natrinema sp. 1APR25-10V2]
MGSVFVFMLLIAVAFTLVLWLAISRETSDPTVVDRAEAERIAKERGGRRPSAGATRDDDDEHGDRRDVR